MSGFVPNYGGHYNNDDDEEDDYSISLTNYYQHSHHQGGKPVQNRQEYDAQRERDELEQQISSLCVSGIPNMNMGYGESPRAYGDSSRSLVDGSSRSLDDSSRFYGHQPYMESQNQSQRQQRYGGGGGGSTFYDPNRAQQSRGQLNIPSYGHSASPNASYSVSPTVVPKYAQKSTAPDSGYLSTQNHMNAMQARMNVNAAPQVQMPTHAHTGTPMLNFEFHQGSPRSGGRPNASPSGGSMKIPPHHQQYQQQHLQQQQYQQPPRHHQQHLHQQFQHGQHSPYQHSPLQQQHNQQQQPSQQQNNPDLPVIKVRGWGNRLAPSGQTIVYAVHFKQGSRYYVPGPRCPPLLAVGEFVITQCSRGQDLGVVSEILTIAQLQQMRLEKQLAGFETAEGEGNISQIVRVAGIIEKQALPKKHNDEQMTLDMTRDLALNKYGLDMNVVDCEYQFDHEKLTIYYTCESRVDFRDLVKELCAILKIRIWMKDVTKQVPEVLNPAALEALATGVSFN